MEIASSRDGEYLCEYDWPLNIGSNFASYCKFMPKLDFVCLSCMGTQKRSVLVERELVANILDLELTNQNTGIKEWHL